MHYFNNPIRTLQFTDIRGDNYYHLFYFFSLFDRRICLHVSGSPVRESLETITATQNFTNFPPSASVADHWEPYRRRIVLLAPDLSSRPDLKAPIHALLLISGPLFSFACFPHLPTLRGIIALIGTAQHFCLSAKTGSLTEPATSFFSFFFHPPLRHNWKAGGFSESSGYLRAHCIAPNCLKKKNKRAWRNKKKTPDYHKRDKNVSF